MANWTDPLPLNPLTTEVWEFPSAPLFPSSSLYSSGGMLAERSKKPASSQRTSTLIPH